MSMKEVVDQIKDLNEQNIALQRRLGQAEQEVIRQRGAIEQSAHVVAALSLVATDSRQQTLQAMMKPTEGKQALADAKGSGKPSLFNNNEQDFVKWSREIAKYMNSVREGLDMVLASAVDEEEVWTGRSSKRATSTRMIPSLRR